MALHFEHGREHPTILDPTAFDLCFNHLFTHGFEILSGVGCRTPPLFITSEKKRKKQNSYEDEIDFCLHLK
jgi:hypothetical protein